MIARHAGTLRGLAAVALALAALAAAPAAAAQDSTRSILPPDTATLVRETLPIRVRDPGPGRSGRILRAILARPHVAFRGDTARATRLRRDTTFATTVVVLGGDATVASAVRGDVVVVDGDLFLHPGARIEGRAIAWGGCVYESSLALVRGGTICQRDHTFAIERGAGEITLAYRDLERFPVPMVQFPAFGLHMPQYTRVDGVVVPWGPTLTFAKGGVEAWPTIAYRSHLGAIDPQLAGRVRLGRRNHLTGEIGRATFTHDRWIRSDLVNSFTTLVGGVDTRNYFRADRAELRVHRAWEGARRTVTPMVGTRWERAWSTGPDSAPAVRPHAPWTVMSRRDPERILRPNPDVLRGNMASALVGVQVEEEETPAGLTASYAVLAEFAPSLPGGADASTMTQVTGDLELGFPTFGTQSFEFLTHVVLTPGGAAPPQRYAYLGGNGTLLTLDLLELGGDHLAYFDSRYHVPVEAIQIPFAGAPIVTLRHAIGTAGVGRFPKFVQNVGVRLTIAVLRVDYTIDPASRESNFDISFSVAR